jgi:hypothetical protein
LIFPIALLCKPRFVAWKRRRIKPMLYLSVSLV